MHMGDHAKKRIGLTMRVVSADGYVEPRDALAQDWTALMSNVLPLAAWIPIPNLGNQIAAFVEDWEIDGLIFTGGNDVGRVPERDETEFQLLEVARRYEIPVLGICRGMQVICKYFGYPVIPCPAGGHAGTTHGVRIIEPPMGGQGGVLTVNSYHDQCVGKADTFTDCVRPFALSDDGLVEGVVHRDEKILGIMWHPERNDPAADFDAHLIQSFFND